MISKEDYRLKALLENTPGISFLILTLEFEGEIFVFACCLLLIDVIYSYIFYPIYLAKQELRNSRLFTTVRLYPTV